MILILLIIRLGVTVGYWKVFEKTNIPTWAALGAKRLHQVEIPQQVAELHIFADDDNPGRAAANRAKDRHTHAGCRVVIRFPPKNCGDS